MEQREERKIHLLDQFLENVMAFFVEHADLVRPFEVDTLLHFRKVCQ